MKMKILLLLLIIMIFTPTFFIHEQDVNEKSMQDFIFIFLDKTMHQAVYEYYGKPRMYYLYDAKIVEMKQLKEECFSSEIKV